MDSSSEWLLVAKKNYFLGRFLEKVDNIPITPCVYIEMVKVIWKLAMSMSKQKSTGSGLFEKSYAPLWYSDFEIILRNNKYTSLMAEQFAEHNVPITLVSALNHLTILPLKNLFGYISPPRICRWFSRFCLCLFSGSLCYSYIKYWQVTNIHP